MASKRAKADAKAKQKRQKIILAVGGVLLVGLLAFQLPRTLKIMNQLNGQQSSSTTSSATTTASTTPAPAGTPPADGSLTPPTLAGSAPAATRASSGGLAESDPVPAAQDGQLVSFSRFVAKDPFNQQLDVGAGTSPTGTTTIPTGTGGAVPPGTTTTAPTPPPANPTSATISVNGVSETVQLGATFPASAAQPYFKLVSLGPNAARIGIAGGTLATGAPTVTLVKGKKLTLQNTADGTRYELVLVSTS